MFESPYRLRDDVRGLLDALRALAEGRYAAVFDRRGVIVESPTADTAAPGPLRGLLESHAAMILRIPAALHAGEEMDDAFAEWSKDEFFLAFVNGRVGILVACSDAQRVEDESAKLLRALVDRLLRLNAAWRVDERGRGLFAGRPRLDTVVIGRANG